MTVYYSGVVLGFMLGVSVLIACIVWIVKDVFEIRCLKKTLENLTGTYNEDFDEATKALEKEKE